MKIATLDIESTGLDAVAGGMIICAVVKPLDSEELRVFRYDDLNDRPGKEVNLLKKLIEEISKYHLLVGQNIDNFDWYMIKSRALILNVPMCRPPLSYDTMKAFGRTGYRTVLNHIGKPSKALDMMADFFGVEQMKTKIYPREHWKTVWEEGKERKKAVDNLVVHCAADVVMTEKIYWRLMEVDSVDRIRRLK